MYKDVWKKFGWKMLIAVCSVLLLGGVAFAAPRLQAADDLISLDKVDCTGGTVKTGPSIYISKSVLSNLAYGIDENGDAKSVRPQALMYKAGPDEEPKSLMFDQFFEVVMEDGTEKAGSASLTFSAREGNGIFVGGTSNTIKYEIKKSNINNMIEDGNELQVKLKDGGSFLKAGNQNTAILNKSDLEISYVSKTAHKKIVIPDAEYKFSSGDSASFSELGSRPYEIIFDNYTCGGDSLNYQGSISVKKSVSYLNVCYEEDGAKHLLKDFNKEQEEQPKNIFLIDGEDPNSSSIDAVHYEYGFYGTDGARPYIKVKAKEDSALYWDTYDFYYTVKAKDFDVSLPSDFPRNYIYDEEDKNGLGYIKIPDYLIDNNTKQPIYSDGLYEPLTSKDFAVMRGGEVIDGATAGTVRILVKGKGMYQGATCALTYSVSRSLNSAKAVFDIKPTISDINGQGIYEYGDDNQHKPEVAVYFSDSPKYTLVLNTDYTIEYSNRTFRDKENPIKGNTELAGQVTMTVFGKGSEGGSGYYGTLSSSPYVIGAKTISSENGYTLDLNPDSPDSMKGIFIYTGQEIDVTEKAIVKHNENEKGDYIQLAELEESNDYIVTYYDSNNTPIDSSRPKEPGKYKVEYTFRGNFKGTLTADFSIEAKPLKDCVITVLPCEGEETINNHRYNTYPHEPKVKVEYWDKESSDEAIVLPESAYKIVRYEDNTEPGEATIVLEGKASSTDVFRKHFMIVKNTFDSKTVVELPNEYYKKSGEKYHSYVGREREPELNTVKIGKATLEKDVDYTIEGLYTEAGEKVTDATYPSLSSKYKFYIKGKDSFDGYAFTESFQLDAKNLTDVTIECRGLDRTDHIEYTLENEQNYIRKNLVVFDTAFNETLICDEDYEIDIGGVVDNKAKKGTVQVTINAGSGGCYSGSKTFTYNVGQDIAKANVFDKEQRCIPDASGQVWLVNDYPASNSGDGRYEVPFADEKANIPSSVYLSLDNKLFYGKHYDVDYEFVDYIDGIPYAVATLQGMSGYYGTREIYFKVQRIDIGKATITILTPEDDIVYSSYRLEPKIQVTFAGKIVDESNYEIAYDNNVSAGDKAIVTVTGKLLYKGTVSKNFVIKPRNLSDSAHVWIEGLEESYPYAENTTEKGTDGNEITLPGVRPQVNVYFDPEGRDAGSSDKRILLERGDNKDYNLTYKNENNGVWTRQADDPSLPDNAPTIIITANNGNFTGEIKRTFQITPVNLGTDYEVVILNPEAMIFDGEVKKPEFEVVRKDDHNISVSKGAYNVSFSDNNLFVSGKMTDQCPKVTITPKESNKNYIGQCFGRFTIRGDLSQNSALRAANSEVLVEEKPTDYVESGNYDPENFFIIQFKEKKEGTFWPETGNQQQIPLIYGEDYTIPANTYTYTVGAHPATITGTGRFFGTLNNYAVVIRGDLGADYTTFKDPGVVTIDSIPADSKKYLADRIAPVVCGGKTLTYGVDYDFETVPKMDLGTWEVMIKPTKEAGTEGKGYLIGSRTITYTVKQGIEGFHIEGLKNSYEYKHGDSVITKDDFKVYASEADVPSGSALYYGDDYEISEKSQLKERGQGRLVILGKGRYAGEMTYPLTITQYNLAEHYKDNELNITYNKKPEYSGTQISAKELEVEIKTSDGKYTIDPEEYNVVVKSDSGADYVNRTKEGDADPVFKIVSRENNYTGEIDAEELSFKIQPKVLTADLFSIPSEVEYHEKDTEPPVPKGMYNGIPLRGERYRTDVTDYDDKCDFSYTYEPTDTKTGGVKAVKITGYGNFSGTVSLEYTVTKKDISSSDIVLTLTTPEPYIYNGHKQMPAFELTYEGETILVYDGQKASVTRLLNPSVTYSDNENAGTGIIQIEAQENDPNYTGQKDYTFTIEPLPIDNHISFLWGSEGKNLASFKLELPRDGQEWTADGGSYIPKHLASKEETGALPEDNNSYVRVYYNDSAIKDLELFGVNKADYNADAPVDYTIDRYYVEPDTDDTRIREEYDNQDFINAGKVKVTITGTGNYTGTACYWYYIGTDISAEGASSLQKTTTVFNAQQQWPVEVVSGLDASKYRIVRYRHAVTEENILGEKPVKDKDGGDTKAFIDADTYYIRIEGKPEAGTYSSKPIQLTYTILPRSINRVLIDGYKAEYQYTGSAVCPAGLTVTDPIDEIRYKLTENKDYTISYSNNINAGVASIIIKGQGNYDSGTTATARFTITSSTISSGSSGGNGGGNSAGSSDGSSGQLAGPSSAISADDVRLTMDTSDAMYYTGSAVYPGVYISGMTENIDYTVTFSNNINVGQGIVTIRGINNSSGVITKTFRIIGDLAKCSVAAIPDQAYTGLAVTPGVTVTCGTNTLLQGTDYTLSYANNINIGTASVVITAARDSNYVGSVTVNFSIGNGISSAVVSGYASHYTYTGEPITPAVSVAAGSATLRAGTDYTVEYADNTNAGTATMTITGKGVYSGTQKVTFVIEPKSIASCTTTDVSGKKYTGDAYTPAVTVSDGGKTLTNGVDYTVTYANNTNPGVASIIIRALNDNYTGTKTINFRIGTVAVSNFHAGNIKSTSMTLAWTAQDYASGYQICDANSRVVKNSTKNKVTLTGLTSGKTYKYKVRSFIRRADGTRAYGSFSTVISATTKLKTPTVKAASTGKNKARIRWSKVTGATGYQIYYSKSATKGFKKLKTTKNTVRTLNIRGLSSGQRYFFRVRAYKRVGSKNIYSNYNSLKAITVK